MTASDECSCSSKTLTERRPRPRPLSLLSCLRPRCRRPPRFFHLAPPARARNAAPRQTPAPSSASLPYCVLRAPSSVLRAQFAPRRPFPRCVIAPACLLVQSTRGFTRLDSNSTAPLACPPTEGQRAARSGGSDAARIALLTSCVRMRRWRTRAGAFISCVPGRATHFISGLQASTGYVCACALGAASISVQLD